MIAGLPPLAAAYLHDVLVQAAAPLVLSFDGDWNLRGAQGDASRFNLDVARAASVLRDLFLGVPTREPQAFPFVELGAGRHVHAHLVPDGEGFHIILLDATTETARTRAAQQLGHDAELASHEKSRALKRLKRVRDELEQRNTALNEAHALKDALMATLSHEFRTPLTSIFGYLHLLEKNKFSEEGRLKALRTLRRAATHLYALSENLLEFAREGQAGSLVERQRVDPAALAEDLRALFEPIAQEQNLTLTVDARVEGKEWPLTDPTKLRQIAINLMSNALRYTSQGEVRVDIAWDGTTLALTVADTGPGIAVEQQAKIFEPFHRGGQRGGRGAGLGLAIVKRLVEQLQGAIEVHSAPGQGSRFIARLPSLPPETDTAPPAFVEVALPRLGGDAVVADDDEDVRGLIKLLLVEMGFHVHEVGTANDAYERVLAVRPPLAVIDAQMPGLSGNAAIHRLRSGGYAGRIIALSANPTVEAREAALRAGANLFLTKPLDPAAFARAVAHGR